MFEEEDFCAFDSRLFGKSSEPPYCWRVSDPEEGQQFLIWRWALFNNKKSSDNGERISGSVEPGIYYGL